VLLLLKEYKELKMIKKVLIGLTVILIVAVANEGSRSYTELDYKTENYILKLKLEIYELKEKNSELENIIEQLQLDEADLKEEELNRAKAIIELKKELKLRRDM